MKNLLYLLTMLLPLSMMGQFTQLVDMTPGSSSTWPISSVEWNGAYVMYGNGGLWLTDGTPTGTVRLGDASALPVALGENEVFFVGANPRELWKSDGTVVGTSLVLTMNIESGMLAGKLEGLFHMNGNVLLVYSQYDGLNPDTYSFWNYTIGTTTLSRFPASQDIQSGFANIKVSQFYAGSDFVMIRAEEDDGFTTYGSLLGYDGTQIVNLHSYISELQSVLFTKFGLLYIEEVDIRFGYINDLFVTDGKTYMTGLNINPNDWQDLMVREMSTHLLALVTSAIGTDVFAIDASGKTILYSDSYARYASIPVGHFDGVGVFEVRIWDEEEHDYVPQTWLTNGTPTGTINLTSLQPNWVPEGFAGLGTEVFFVAEDATYGRELWKTDGTAGGTQLVKDMVSGPGGGAIEILQRVGSHILFFADDGVNGVELWTTDGTSTGTLLLQNMVAGAGGVSDHTVILASETDLLLGITHTGSTVSMWRTDGTVAGTQLIQEDMGDNGKINSSQIVRDFGSNLIFVDWTPALGSELYRTTETGTPVLINDLNPGSGSGFEQKLGLIGEKILFRGNDGLTGFEPWVYDLDVEALEPNVAQRCEFQANTYTLGMQAYPSTAMHESGNYVVVWWSEGQDGSERGVFGQRYYANGAPQGPEFQVNAATESRQDVPIVAMDAEGDFVVVWESWFQDGSYFGIYGQRYNQYGQPQGGAFRVNQTTLNSQFLGSVATDALGNFVVTWSSEGQDGDQNGVFARMYDDQGIALGDEFPVNSNTTGDQEVSAIAMNASGAFVITWQSDGQDGSGLGIYAQRYDQNGIAQGGEFLVNSNTTGDQTWPTVSMQDNGSFVIAWQGLGLNQDGSGAGIFAQRFQQDGTPLGGEFQVNTFTSQAQLEPSIGMAADGRFAICWHGSGNQDGDGFGIFGQEYDAYGLRIGDEFQVNTFTAGDQVFPEIAMNSIGEYVIVWHSEVQDGSSWGIFGQRYGTNPDNPCTGNMDPDFTLVDAQADTLIGPIANGDVLDLTYLPTNRLNIIAHFDDESLPLTKVVFDFNQGTIALNDWHVPYSMAGDNQAGNFYYYSFTPGAYSLSAEAYTNSANGGGVINTKTLHFTVIRSPQLVTGLSLVDALNNVILGPLHEGDVIDLATIGHNRLNVIAHTAPNDIGSVDFDLRGDAVYDRYDNQPPYCMPGDNQAGGYYQYRFNPGSYTLTATPYTVYAAGGDAGSPLTIGFTVVNTGARLGLSTETLTAFPNPTTGKLNLQFLNVPGGKAQLYILNLQGQTLEMRTLDVVPGSSTQALQVHDLASGMYVLYCRMGEMRYSTRIIKQ